MTPVIIGIAAGIGAATLVALLTLALAMSLAIKNGGGKVTLPGWPAGVIGLCVGVIVALLV